MVSVIYEDKDFVVIDKPAGLLVHSTKISDSKQETLVDWLLKHYPEIKGVGDSPDIRPGIVHRLDKDTSGVLIVARNQKFFEFLKKLFQEHNVKKVYIALVWGRISKKGVIDQPIGLKPGTIKRTTKGKRTKMVKEAITEYCTLKYFKKDGEEFTLTELYPKTGRTHQLRVHMASIHHPIVGDAVYGKKKHPFNLKRQFLHAQSIEFSLPGNRRVKFEANLPKDLVDVLYACG